MSLNSQQREIEEVTNLLLTTLSPREERILKMRFGFGGAPESSLEEVARNLHISKSTVNQIESRALRKLRHPFRLLSRAAHSPADLQRAIRVFQSISEATVTNEEVAAKINAELPELSSLADVLPSNRVELYAFVQTLVLILTLLAAIAIRNPGSSGQVQQTTNIFITQPDQREVVKPKARARTKGSRVKKSRSKKRL